MSGVERWHLWIALVVIHLRVSYGEDVSCSRIDFDQATVTYLSRCSFYQEFISKPYAESLHFEPFRKDSQFYLSNRWEGLTCGETVDSFSMNEATELRMVYNLIFESGATLEVRVIDLDRIDSDDNPTVVIRWKTEQPTMGWGLFREKMDKTVKRAKIQIEANMNARSDVAIEYFTVFNFEVETNECLSIDEFAPIIPTSTTTPQPFTTTTTTATATTTLQYSSSSTPFIEDLSSTTGYSTTSTSSIETSTEASTSTTLLMSTTFSPRDESTSMSTQKESSTTTVPSTHPQSSTPEYPPTPEANPNEWLWITLAAVFAFLFCLAIASSAYIYAVNKHLLGLITQLKEKRTKDYHLGRTQCLRNLERHGVQKQVLV